MPNKPSRPKPPPRKKNTPAVPVFPDAYLYDTRHLSLDEHGAYFLLLMAAWRMPDCALPDDDRRLARILSISEKRWARLKPVVMQFWTHENGRWTQKRLLQERRYVEHKREVNTLSAEERWNRQVVDNEGEGGSERISERTSERISERNAPQPQPLESIPSSNEDGRSGASSNDPEGDTFDPIKALFDDGISVLGKAGVKQPRARSLIGQWRKAHGDEAVALALAAAEAQHISQPLEWIPKWLASRTTKGNPGASTGDGFMDAMAADYLGAKKGEEK